MANWFFIFSLLPCLFRKHMIIRLDEHQMEWKKNHMNNKWAHVDKRQPKAILVFQWKEREKKNEMSQIYRLVRLKCSGYCYVCIHKLCMKWPSTFWKFHFHSHSINFFILSPSRVMSDLKEHVCLLLACPPPTRLWNEKVNLNTSRWWRVSMNNRLNWTANCEHNLRRTKKKRTFKMLFLLEKWIYIHGNFEWVAQMGLRIDIRNNKEIIPIQYTYRWRSLPDKLLLK